MGYLLLKAALSGVIIAVASEVARRNAVMGALIASLPLVSLLGILWLWRDTGDAERIASHMTGTLWYVIPSLPMFVLVPALLRAGRGFWPSLAVGCLLTFVLYLVAMALMARFGPRG